MPKTIDIYSPRTLLAAQRLILPVNTFLKDTFFTGGRTFVTEFVDIDTFKGRRKMAPFVAPRLPGKVMERDGFKTSTYKAPLIKPKRVITAGDLQNRLAGENIYSEKAPDERAQELLADDMIFLDDAITRREEWMASQVLFTGKVIMKGEGVDEVLDYGFTNKEVLSGTALWTDTANSDPIAYIKAKRLKILQDSGMTPTHVLMASDVVDTFKAHPKVKEMMDIRNITLGKIEPKALPNGVTYIGTITELGLDVYSYDEWFVDDDTDPENPVEGPMVPAGTIAILSSRAAFGFNYGGVTLVDKNTEQFITYEGKRIPDSWIEKDPAQRFLQVNSRPVPIPRELSSWFVAKVK